MQFERNTVAARGQRYSSLKQLFKIYRYSVLIMVICPLNGMFLKAFQSPFNSLICETILFVSSGERLRYIFGENVTFLSILPEASPPRATIWHRRYLSWLFTAENSPCV